jgi:hypothetical protein
MGSKGLASQSLYADEPEKQKAQSQGLGFCLNLDGAGKRNRTPDLRITNALLYRLSYSGIRRNKIIGTSLLTWQVP